MTLNARITQQIILFSLLVLIIPMVVFPERFGTGLAKISIIYIILEFGYYLGAAYFLNRGTSLIKAAQAAGICFLYRVALGAVLALFLTALYSTNIKVSMLLAITKYLPAILLQIAATPFILKPALEQILSTGSFHHRRTQKAATMKNAPFSASGNYSSRGLKQGAYSSKGQMAQPFSGKSLPSVPKGDLNGFDNATRYISEDASVQMVVVVDHEGLALSQFVRSDIDAEEWAPMALLLHENNNQILAHRGLEAPERIALTVQSNRIIIAYEESFSLMVISKRQPNDILDIRISKGLDIIRKYVEERYGGTLIANTESAYA